LPYYASVRIEVRSPNSKRITVGSQAVGQLCTATVKKNKVAPPHRQATYELYYESGIATEASLLEVAEDVGVVTRAGASYTEVATGERIGVGKEAAKLRLAEDPELRDRLVNAVYATTGLSDPVDVPAAVFDVAGMTDLSPVDALDQ
jgi:recombination protein RecA